MKSIIKFLLRSITGLGNINTRHEVKTVHIALLEKPIMIINIASSEGPFLAKFLKQLTCIFYHSTLFQSGC